MSKIVVKDFREQILLRPEMWFGDFSVKTEKLMYYSSKFEIGNKTYSPALLKMFDEVITNCTDVYSKYPKINGNIQVTIKPNSFVIKGYGPNIVIKKENNKYTPELAFSHLFSSSNYDDTKQRKCNGQNGVGVKLVNIYSLRFEINIYSKGTHYTQTFENNMSIINKPKVEKYYTNTPDSVEVSVYPDFKRLGINEIEIDDLEILKFRSICCTLFNRDVEFKTEDFKNKELCKNLIFSKNNFETFSKKMKKDLLNSDEFEDEYVHITNDLEIYICIVPTKYKMIMSFVNNIYTSDNGTHVNNVLRQIKKIPFKINSNNDKSPTNYLFMILNQNIDKPKFNSQSKSKLCNIINTSIKQLCDKLYKSQTLEKYLIPKAKKESVIIYSKCRPAHKAGTSESRKCSLYITEGDSASAMANKGFGEIGYTYNGIFTLRGKILNVTKKGYDAKIRNKILKYLLQELGLVLNGEELDRSELRYGRIIILKDADVDGDAIMGLVYNIFFNEFKYLITQDDFFYEFITPAYQIILKDLIDPKAKNVNMSNNVKLEFNSEYAFNEQMNKLDKNKILKIHYIKGLGSISDPDIHRYFKNIDKHLKSIIINKEQLVNTNELMFNLYSGGKKEIEFRKKWINNYDETVMLERNVIKNINIIDFMEKCNIHYAYDSCIRSIPSLYDGLKPSQRKILYTLFKRGKESYNFQKVTSLSGDVTKIGRYLHGEASLEETIFGMMRYWAGSNNIPLLKSMGTIGSRLDMGTMHSQSRYVFTALNEISRFIFIKDDDEVLDYVKEEGEYTEPNYYVPIVPIVLINGGLGIGTGYSTDTPQHNPFDCINYIKDILTKDCNKNGIKTLDSDVKIRLYFPNCDIDLRKEDGEWISYGKQKFILPEKSKDRFWNTTCINKNKPYDPLSYNPCFISITQVPIYFNYHNAIQNIKKSISENVVEKYKNIIDLRDGTIYGSLTEKENVNLILKINNDKKDCKLGNIIPLTETIYYTNVHLIDKNGRVQKFESVYDIMKLFIIERYNLYVKRKNYIINKMKESILIDKNRARFIKAKVMGIKCIGLDNKEYEQYKLDTRNMKINVLEKFLETNKFDKIKNSYSYIIDYVTTRHETFEEYQKIMNTYNTKVDELIKYMKTPINVIWLNELNNLETELKKYYSDMNYELE